MSIQLDGSGTLTSTQPSGSKLLAIPEVAQDIAAAAETINNHFSKYNNTIPPLDRTSLPCFLPHNSPPVSIPEVEVYRLLKGLSTSKAPGPNDIPLRLMVEFAPELAYPLADIYKCSLQHCVFPSPWKATYVTPVPKEPVPSSLDQLRPISKTAVPSKFLEKIVTKEIWQCIRHKIDPKQYGNIEGSSTVHYLVELVDQIASSTDSDLAVTMATIDLRKAFDLIDHTILVMKMLRLGIPEHLVLWTMSFLADRQQCTQALGELSEPRSLSCGVPQGTVLGPLLFLIMVNDDVDNLARLYKFVDDKTIAITHAKDSVPPLQPSIDRAVEWATANNMQVNEKKCNILKFNFTKSPPDCTYFINGSQVQCPDELNLLGVILRNDLKWKANTDFMVTKCNRKFFMFAKLKAFRASRDDLLRVWTRPICEYAAPLWHSSLNAADTSKIERVQKRALRLILGSDYSRYSEALETLKIPSMSQRRQQLCLKFGKSLLKSPKFKHLLPLRDSVRNLRNNSGDQVQEFLCNNDRYFNSAIPYLARLLNE